MTITERTLRKWRREALESIKELTPPTCVSSVPKEVHIGTNERILRMTQELLDQHLLRK